MVGMGWKCAAQRRGSGLRCLALAAVLIAAAPAALAQGWSYRDAARPYAGTRIRVLDEITPLQENMKKLVPQFTAETGIMVEYELLSHGDVINKGQADLFSGRGYYDAVMLHSLQMGPLLAARVLEPLDGFLADGTLTDPKLDLDDLIAPADPTLSRSGGKRYGFLTWNYNQVYWARKDLLANPAEMAAFKARYHYALAPARTLEQMRDIAEFFTRRKGSLLAGQPLASDFYGIVLEGIPGGTTFTSMWQNLLANFGGGVLDADGHPAFDTPQNIAALKFWAALWRFSPPGQAEYSLVDVPTVMGSGIAAQTIAWSDFVVGVDKPGGSPYAGRFVYAGIPVHGGAGGASGALRSANGEPSLLGLSHSSRNKQATYLFLEWMIEKDTQARLFAAGGSGVPIRNSSFRLPLLQQPATASLYAAMKDSMAVAVAKPKLPRFFEINDALGPIVQQVGLGTLTPEAAAKAGQEKLLAICTKCTL